MGEQTVKTEVAVIGGGPAGYSAAFRAADLGLEVALINQEEKLGGMCLHRGCIPSKALHTATQILYDARGGEQFGIEFGEPEIDLDQLRKWKDRVVDTLARGLNHLAKQRDVQVIQARAVFESSEKLRLQDSDVAHVAFEHAILASGSDPRALPSAEFQKEGRVMNPGAALALPEIPETLLVVGGSYSGLEIGSRYALLGSRVTVVEMLDGLLPSADRDLVKPLARRLKKLFHAIHLNTELIDLEEMEDQVRVTLEGEVEASEQTFDRVVVCVGCGPNTENLGVENTAVEVDENGFVMVDEERRTADERIFAVGDVVGGQMLAHKAMYEGKVAAEVIAGEPAAYDVRCVPSVVYTDPQVAWCGLTEEQAEEEGREVGVGRFPWSAAGRALTMGTREGLTKILFDPETERVLGVGIVGQDAESLISEAALAIEMGALAQDLALTIHPHPTLSETVAEAADAFLGRPTHITP